MNKLLTEEYFHLGTDKILKELWLNVQMEQIYKSYIKPYGGLWTSHQNEETISDWLEFKLKKNNPYELEIIRYMKSCLVKFKNDSKFLKLETDNDYKNLKDSGFIKTFDTPLIIDKWYETIKIDEILDYEQISKYYDVMYISPYANNTLNNFSINTMYALNPNSIEYYKPTTFNLDERTITNIGEKEYIKNPTKDFKHLVKHIRYIIDTKTKNISYTTYDEYIKKLYEIIKQTEDELCSKNISYFIYMDIKDKIINRIIRNIYKEKYTEAQKKLIKK